MSLVRDFAYAFLASERVGEFGLVTRVLTPLLLLSSLSLPYVVPGSRIPLVQTAAALAYEAVLVTYLAGSRRLLGVLRLVGLFLVLGFALNLLSALLGFEPSDAAVLVTRTLRMASIVIALTLVFQLLTVGEMRLLLRGLGLERYSEMFAVAMSQLPTTLVSFSEAYVVAKLKLGRRRIAALVKPLVVDSVLNSRQVAEALYIHGIPPAPKPKLVSRRDPLMLVPAILVSLAYALL